MELRAHALVIATRPHGESASIARFFTQDSGLIAAYVAGGRGRQLRPVLIPGNRVATEIRSKSANQLPFARVELVESRAPWMSEPLPAAALQWACALTASVLPERQAYGALYTALDALLGAVCHAPSARGWLPAMTAYEAMVLREMGYGDTSIPDARLDANAGLQQQFELFRALHRPIRDRLLADSVRDVMAARTALGERLARMM